MNSTWGFQSIGWAKGGSDCMAYIITQVGRCVSFSSYLTLNWLFIRDVTRQWFLDNVDGSNLGWCLGCCGLIVWAESARLLGSWADLDSPSMEASHEVTEVGYGEGQRGLVESSLGSVSLHGRPIKSLDWELRNICWSFAIDAKFLVEWNGNTSSYNMTSSVVNIFWVYKSYTQQPFLPYGYPIKMHPRDLSPNLCCGHTWA